MKFTNHEANIILVQPSWNGIIIDMSTREFLKEYHKKAINKKWSKLNRNKRLLTKEIQEESKFEWKAIWKSKTRKKFHTFFKDNQRKTFWIKLI